MSYIVQIAGSTVSVEAGSLFIDSTIGRRSTASFKVRTPNTTTHFRDYQQIAIYNDSSVLSFTGYITSPKEQKPGYQTTLRHTITCCDQHYLADKRRVTAGFSNTTCATVVKWLIDNILVQEGVTIGAIYDGIAPFVPLYPSATLYPSSTLYPQSNANSVASVVFSYAKVSDALDALAKQASAAGVPYYWQIDLNKKLWFVPYIAVVNSSVIDGTLIDHVSNPPSVVRSNSLYRNTQYLTGGVTQTLLQNENRLGDGNTTVFTMSYALSTAPTVTLNGSPKTVGMQGLDTGKDFYWQQGSQAVTQDSNGVKLISTDVLNVIYIGQYPSVFSDRNSAQITARAAIDGTSGIVEDVINDATISSAANGLSEVGQALVLYAKDGVILTFTTRQTGFAQGQLVTVNLPMHNLYNAQMLIEDVSISDQSDGLNMWSTITAIQGPYDQNWVYFFSKLMAQQQPANAINVGVSQSLTLLASFTASVTPTATFTGTCYAVPVPSSTLYPSSTLFPG